MCVCQHLKVGQLQAQIDSLALQLHNAQAAVLAHQRERLLAEHKLSQAEHQVAKLTQMLQARRRHKFSKSTIHSDYIIRSLLLDY